MTKFSIPITTAVALFPFVALIITVPFMVRKYRKLGSVPLSHALIAYSFVFYLMCAYFLVLLPLPADRTAYVASVASPQLEPFHFLKSFMASTTATLDNPASWLSVATDPTIYEAFFNVLLLLPLGAYLRYYFKRTWWQTLIIGFLVTLSFELTQLTGIWGIYEHPYRLFDVDDLITNTTGAMLGFWLVGPVMRVLPDLRLVEREAKRRGRSASATRRALSFAIDMTLAIGIALATFACAKRAYAGGQFTDDVRQVVFWVATSFALAVTFAAIPLMTKGQTAGQKILKLHVVTLDAKPATWLAVAARYAVLFALLLIPAFTFTLIIGVSSMPTSTGELKDMVSSAIHGPVVLMALWSVGVLTWAASLILRAVQSARKQEEFIMLNGLATATRVMTASGIAEAQARRQALDVADVVALEQRLAANGTPLDELMRRAGAAVADEVRSCVPDPASVVILAGSGNNGGDGWVCGRLLARAGWPVTLVTPKAHERISAQPAQSEAFETIAAATAENLPFKVLIAPEPQRLAEAIDGAACIVDAMLGTGFQGESVREPYATWINLSNKRRFVGRAGLRGRLSAKAQRIRWDIAGKATHARPGHAATDAPFALAVDVPSGLSAQTGTAALPRFYADETVTMLAFKPGLIAKPAASITGYVELAELVDRNLWPDREKAAANGQTG